MDDMKPVLQQQSQRQHTTQRKDEVKWVKISINNLYNFIAEKYSTSTLYVFFKIYTFAIFVNINYLWNILLYTEGFFTFHTSLSIISESQTSFLSCSVASDSIVSYMPFLQ